MPYYMECTSDLKCLVEWHYEGKPPISERRPFLKGDPISDLDIEKFPKKIIVTNVKDPKQLPEVIANGADLGIVNLEVKNYLEQHDPGLHRFFPIDVQLAGTDYVMEYFFLYSSNKISSVCYEKTRFKEGFGKEAAKKSLFMPKKSIEREVKCMLHKKNVEGINIWRNPNSENSLVYFCSDEFGEFVKKHHIRGWALFACEWEG